MELGCILLRYAAPYCATLNPTELCYTLLSYIVTIWGTTTLWSMCTFISNAASYWASLQPCELCCTLWATFHSTEINCILLSYPMALRARLYPTELRCSLLSYAPYCAMLHPTELRCTLLSYAAPFGVTMRPLAYTAASYWATLQPLSYVAPNGAKFGVFL